MNAPAETSHPSPPINHAVLTNHPDGVAHTNAHNVVLLHGWGKNLEALRPLGELLVSDNVKVTLIDLPGFGLSPLPIEATNDGGGWSTAEYAERVVEFLKEKTQTPCTLIGHSFGGRISVRIASKYPDLVAHLVLMASHGIPRQRTQKEQIRISAIRTLSQLSKKLDSIFHLETFKNYFSPRFGSADYKAAGDLRKTLVKTVNEDLSPEAQKIACPTLLLWGEKDTETPLSIARKFRSLIRQSELHIFPNKGHEPYSDVGSHLMAKYITRFLNQTLNNEPGARTSSAGKEG